MLDRVTRSLIAAPRRVLAATALIMVAGVVFGVPVVKSLSAGGFQEPSADSAKAAQVLADTFHRSDLQLIFILTAPDHADAASIRPVATYLQHELHESPFVTDVMSAWTSPTGMADALLSRDHRSGLIVAGITGGDTAGQKHAADLTKKLAHDHDGVTVKAGGMADLYGQVNRQIEHDLLVMESIAIPLSFAVLVWVFGGIVASLLPLLVAVFAIIGSVAVLRLITFVTDVSIFALNLTVAMGLALAIDYTLLIISRYREELTREADRDSALLTTMRTAGRTVLFSACTVALALLTLLLFPMYFVRSFAYAGVAVVLLASVAAMVIAPTAIALLGERIDSLDIRRLIRRVRGRPEPSAKPITETFWYRNTRAVMRRAIPIGVGVMALLLTLGAPFLDVKLGYPDDRILPTSAPARQVGDQLRQNFPFNTATAVTVVLRDPAGIAPTAIEDYAARLSRVSDVSQVSTPTGAYVDGVLAGPPAAPSGIRGDTAFLTISSTAAPLSTASERQLDALHAVAAPHGTEVEFAGSAQMNRDTVHSTLRRMPWVLGIIAAVTLVLMFLVTGSVVLPIKAVVLNVLSLTATFGALVWVFQQGHLSGLGTTATGTIAEHLPVLLFCIAFGLSMDYEVFLMSRIGEFWQTSNRTPNDNVEAVALGLARTGRVITAAALLMAISFAALIASQVSFMRVFGLGLTLAVLIDATLVRILLVPSFMRIIGRANWWAPKWLAGPHARWRMSHGSAQLCAPRGDGVAVTELLSSQPPAARSARRGQQRAPRSK
ncbi:MMPL family transporter [Mycobacterium sp.]|uniref:MMPL family transporter n=1 Tax=Mycobacterium sp. TaxID=1785 RepID=UPI003CC5CBFF